ncbi:hypothetical protein [Saccharibacillus alkalitolerans]|uniref:Uncharacterized protein n=1 Tax=Saccharibacillus alkalitolerans TaxID=2705290 RepID=A0ABX0FC12_9BACL|nr:hypothetical protein [Saccharibacillus alkalitolerans]NGZ77818.1 hypothetical protein [Saccharibacillus alkalitolerans]
MMNREKGIRRTAAAAFAAVLVFLPERTAEVRAYAGSEESAAAASGAAAYPTNAEKTKLEIVREANLALRALADRDFDALADLAAPRGIRFSPYAYVELKSDRVLTPGKLRQAWKDPETYVWGAYDGSGEPIVLDFRGYYARFLNNLPYTAPDGVGYNRVVRSGNTLSNLKKAYPKAKFVEFYVKGGRSGAGDVGGMDWGSLRFVFEQTGSDWQLIGIVGDRWTI